jgi:nucleoside-diphosphate-sugar epimerase
MADLNLKGKKVLVTGSEGFIGSHLTEQLLDSGAEVRAFVMYNFKGDLGWISDIRNKVEICQGDIKDYNAVNDAMKGIDVVLNLAASISVPYSVIHPREVVETNVIGGLNVLLASKEQGVGRVVQMSSSEVFGNPKYVPIDEVHPKNPQSPYAASKVGMDALCNAFYCSYNLPVVIIRPFNTFGPRQSPRAIIPSIILQLLDGNVVKAGNVFTTRDLTYVEDTAKGVIHAGFVKGIEGQEINLGTGSEVLIKDLIETIARLMGKADVEVVSDSGRKRTSKLELVRLLSNNSLAMKQLKWEPSYTLEAGLKKTIAWFEKHRDEYGKPYYAEYR